MPLGAALIAVPLAALALLVGCLICVALVFGQTGFGCGAAAAAELKGVPERLAPIYLRASTKHELGPRGPAILAAINKIESGFGTNMGPSSTGAIGWMQFLPSSWEAYGQDGDGDGDKDPYDPWDAIFAAAHLLAITGAPQDWHDAIFSYNHAEWYVEEVLREAERFAGLADSASAAPALAGCTATVAPNEAVAGMLAEAARLHALRPSSEYVYGGSHGTTPTPPNGPFDCSSAVSHLLQVAGFENPTMTTVGLRSWGEPGPGRWVTIHNKPFGADAHTFIEFMPGMVPSSKRYWGTSGLFAGHGPGFITQSSFSAAYLAGFERRHPPGL